MLRRTRVEGESISDTPLTSMDGWTDDLVAKLAASWITTAEQLVAIANTASGLDSIAEQLQVDRATAQRLWAARARLPEATRRALEEPVGEADLGLGVLPPER
jgi:hypothetical protein